MSKSTDRMADSADPDQTASIGAVWSGSTLFAQTYLSEFSIVYLCFLCIFFFFFFLENMKQIVRFQDNYSTAQVKEPIFFFISRANFTIRDFPPSGLEYSEWKKITRSYALDIPRTFSGPQCTHDIRSLCEYLRVAIDYFVQVSLTTQIILSHDNNQTKIVTTANTINTRITTAGGSRIRLQNVPTYINKFCFRQPTLRLIFYVSAASIEGYIRTTVGSPNAQGRWRIWPKASDDFKSPSFSFGLRVMVAWVFLHSFSCDTHFYPGWPIFPVSLCTCCGCQENNLNPRSTAENSRGDVDLTVLVFYSENKAEHFMWIVCLEDDSHVTPRLIYAGK